MKNSISIFPKIVVLFLTLTLGITSCQKDDAIPAKEVELIETEPDVISRIVAFKEALHFNSLHSQVDGLSDKLNKLSSTQRRDDDEVFEILTDNVMCMAYEDTHSYTFKLVRENPEYYIENIVLYYNTETEIYDEYLI